MATNRFSRGTGTVNFTGDAATIVVANASENLATLAIAHELFMGLRQGLVDKPAVNVKGILNGSACNVKFTVDVNRDKIIAVTRFGVMDLGWAGVKPHVSSVTGKTAFWGSYNLISRSHSKQAAIAAKPEYDTCGWRARRADCTTSTRVHTTSNKPPAIGSGWLSQWQAAKAAAAADIAAAMAAKAGK